jgi:hypothetical protein
MTWDQFLELLPLAGNLVGLVIALGVLALIIRSNEKQQDNMHQRYHALALRAMDCDCPEEKEPVTAMRIGGQTFRRVEEKPLKPDEGE